jgi:predicted DNA-binding WGR domain protein
VALYELEEGTSRKFYRIELHGTRVHLNWGRLDTDGQHQVITCANEAAARAEYETQVAKRHERGYRLVVDENMPRDREVADLARLAKTGNLSANPRFLFVHRRKQKFAWVEARGSEVVHAKGPYAEQALTTPKTETLDSPAAALRERDRLVAKLMGQGYELDTFGKKPKPAKRGAKPVLAENPILEAAVADDPFDEATWSVLEDWVLEQDDPRSDMVRAGKLGEKREEAEARGVALPLLFGERPDPIYDAIHDATWRGGFLVECSYVEPLKHAQALSARFYEAPATRLLRTLAIQVERLARFAAQLPLIAAAPCARSLRRLAVNRTREGQHTVLDITALAALRLETLAIDAPFSQPHGTGTLPVRYLSLVFGSTESAVAWCAQTFPALEMLRLELHLTERSVRADLAPLLEGRFAPAVQTVDVTCSRDVFARVRDMFRDSALGARARVTVTYRL